MTGYIRKYGNLFLFTGQMPNAPAHVFQSIAAFTGISCCYYLCTHHHIVIFIHINHASLLISFSFHITRYTCLPLDMSKKIATCTLIVMKGTIEKRKTPKINK